MPAALIGDATRLRQVLFNLVGNAVKFTQRDEVSLILRSLPLESETHLKIQFVVVDTGIGIDPAVLQSLFDPFTQADSSTSRRFGGTGLGLSISHRLVALMGGELTASSEPAKGLVSVSP
ncbi:MAG: hypothetical protein J6386_01475 [Candidatus Synoicihabitans palmerolidicus]|nr:hypothetical protein [Candidatus Synoicihabitans palmerolidicus]